MGLCQSNRGNGKIHMRIICALFLFSAWLGAISYSVVSADDRHSAQKNSESYQGRFNPKVVANKGYGTQNRNNVSVDVTPAQRQISRRVQVPVQVQPAPQSARNTRVAQSLPVQVTPAQRQSSSAQNYPIEYGVQPYSPPPPRAQMQVPIQITPPVQEREERVQTPQLGVRVYPPTIGNTSRKNNHNVKINVGRSQPITQEMMFYPETRPKMQLPPRQSKKPATPPPPPQPVYEDQYDDEESEPLFIRNRNGVMLGFGIGGAFNRLWVGGSGDNHRFYDNNFTWYFRLGYQHYFTPYLGLRSYVHLGDWMDELNDSFWDGQLGKHTKIMATSNLNYSGYVELLYDFVVLENHSFGIFGGFGVGVGSYEFSNDGTGSVSDYFVMPMVSAGFAYTLYLNNRFELEVKAPLRQGVLEGTYRAEFSTWMFGFTYTYVF